MIDFRYHVVSLVAVFLALATGVILGSGPLGGAIGDSLSNEVGQLRNEKDQLRDQLKAAQTDITNRDTFDRAAIPSLVAGDLNGRTVALLVVPQVADDAVSNQDSAIRAAGADVVGQLKLTDKWPTNDATAQQQVMDALTGTHGTTAATATASVQSLSDRGFLRVQGTWRGPADAVVVLVPAVNAALAGVAPTIAPSVDPAQDAWLSLLKLAPPAQAVVVGPASADTSTGMIAAVRADASLRERVSTVDCGSSPMGDITGVWALRNAILGSVGHYGFGAGATSQLPTPQPTPSRSQSTSTVPVRS